MTTSTPRKTSFENKHLQRCGYFPIISSSQHSTMLVKYASTEPQGAPFKQIQRIKAGLGLRHFLFPLLLRLIAYQSFIT